MSRGKIAAIVAVLAILGLPAAASASSILTVTVLSISATQGTAFSGTVASFTDADGLDAIENYSATISWGDGTSSEGVISSGGGVTDYVSGTHVYLDGGSYTVSVAVTDSDGASGTGQGIATVADSNVFNGTGLSLNLGPNMPFSGPVASFTDSYTGEVASQLFATIDWGDGTSTAGVVTGGDGLFSVSGSHTYASISTYTATITLGETDNTTNTATTTGVVNVVEPITLSTITINATQGSPFAGTVATFDDNLGADPLGNYSATIDWGDGTITAGVISSDGGNNFAISGTHTYQSIGSFTTTVTVVDLDGTSASGNGTAHVVEAECPAGSYSATGSGPSCTPAPAGSYDAGTGNTAPTPCPAGTYNTATGATSESPCTQIPAGSYDTSTSTAPTPCPAGSTSSAGASFCTAATSVTYAGADQVAASSSLTPAATLSSQFAGCEIDRPVVFSVAPDPQSPTTIPSLTVATVDTNSTGTASGTAVTTAGWATGAYTITVTYNGTTTANPQCSMSSTTAALAVTAPGQLAFGYGRYNPPSGPISFGFVVAHARRSTTSYVGQLDVVTPGKWWFQANVTRLGLAGTTRGFLAGTGSLYWWNTAANRGHGAWQLAARGIVYQATGNEATKTSTASFGITFTYAPTGSQPSTLPTSATPLPVTRGVITIT